MGRREDGTITTLRRLLLMMMDTPTPVPTVLLLFDRNVLIRTALADYLRDCGFTVMEVGTVEEVNAVLASEHHIELAFLDIGDDSAQGFTIAQMIRKARPHVKVMMASGVAGAAAEAGDLCENGPMLAKPYDHSILERHIRRLLAS
jgi:DNA-binding response OmpR family regulator